MKALRYILYGLLAAAVIGLTAYQAFVTKDLTGSDLTKAGLLLAGIVFSLIRPQRTRRAGGSKALYQKTYGEFIRSAFSEEPRLEKRFYSAVADYAQDRPAKGVEKLMKLRKECQKTDDIYAVTVFTALCLDDMGLYQEAANEYRKALALRPTSTLASNLGLCCQRLGDLEAAEAAYDQAIRLDPQNAFAYNNASAMYYREGDYEIALEYAEQALDINPGMKQALGTAAICYALLGYQAEYEDHYRRAVAAGYDGRKIKDIIKNLDPEL